MFETFCECIFSGKNSARANHTRASSILKVIGLDTSNLCKNTTAMIRFLPEEFFKKLCVVAVFCFFVFLIIIIILQ